MLGHIQTATRWLLQKPSCLRAHWCEALQASFYTSPTALHGTSRANHSSNWLLQQFGRCVQTATVWLLLRLCTMFAGAGFQQR
jgi:hypothetical protein